MPSYPPRSNTTKKREQLERREQELRHVLRSTAPREQIAHAAEALRTAKLSLLKAELYWAEDPKMSFHEVEDRIHNIREHQRNWTEKSVDEIFREYAPQ